MWNELAVALRRLLHDRSSAGAAIVVSAIGTGLNVAVFAVVYGVLVRPMPYAAAADLAMVDVAIPLAQLEAWRSNLRTFARVGGYAREALTIRGLDEPRFMPVAVVDDAFFATLGCAALAGRSFGPGDGPAAAVISERLSRRIGADKSDLIGRNIRAGNAPITVIGIMPASFAFPSDDIDVWISARAAPAIAFDRSADARHFRLVGRLAAGASIAQAREDVLRARRALDPEFTGTDPSSAGVALLSEVLLGRIRPVLLAFGGAAVVVLLIACANVASILIGRTVARRRELAIRAAIGATRARLFATVLSESLVIGSAGAVLGVALAFGAVRLLGACAAGMVPRLGDVRVDGVALASAVACAIASALLAAAPLLRLPAPDALAIRAPIRDTRTGVLVRSVLAVSQIALAVLLLSAGALLIRTIVDLLRQDTGTEARKAAVTQLIVSDAMTFDASGRRPWIANLLEHVRAIPGVLAAGAGTNLPPDNSVIAVRARFRTKTSVTETPELSLASVTPGYLEALGIRLLRGRYLDQRDEARDDLVVVLSESAARVLMPDVEPIDRPVSIDLPGMRGRGRPTVIGIVADVKYSGLEAARGPALYVLWKQLPAGQLYLAVRTRDEPLALVPMVRRVLRTVDPELPIMPFRRLDEVIERSINDRRLRAMLGGSVGLLAFAIALLGLASGLGRMVTERRTELAIRAALGATPARAIRTVMTSGAVVTGIGIVVGLLATLAAASVLRTLIFGVSVHDPATLGLVALVVAVGSLSACYVPARRAAAADPLEILREP